MALLIAAVLLLAACTEPPAETRSAVTSDEARVRQWKLPKRLREISGLATTRDGRLLAHDDERGIFYELDYPGAEATGKGRIAAEHRFGPRDDYEGIAVIGDAVFVVTSKGRLYRRALDGSGATEVFDTGAGEQCEIEGLTARDARLYAVCKNIYGEPETTIRILSLAPDTYAVDGAIEAHVKKRIHPSGIEWSERDNAFFLVAADDKVVVAVRPGGAIVSRIRLDKHRHHQPEGITFTATGGLVIADEGGKGKGRLTVYP